MYGYDLCNINPTERYVPFSALARHDTSMTARESSRTTLLTPRRPWAMPQA